MAGGAITEHPGRERDFCGCWCVPGAVGRDEAGKTRVALRDGSPRVTVGQDSGDGSGAEGDTGVGERSRD